MRQRTRSWPARLFPASLHFQLTLWYGALVLLVLLAFTGFVYLEVRLALAGSLDHALANRAEQIAASTTVTADRVRFGTDGIADGPDDGLTFIFNTRGTQLLPPVPGSGGIRPDPAAVRRAMLGYPGWTSSADTERFYTARMHDDAGHPFIVQVAESRLGVNETLEDVLTALLLAVPVLVLVSGVGGAFLAGRALRPIDRIAKTARRIGAGDLHERLNLPPRNDEVGRLASTFDAMLNRLEDAFLRQRQFTADASHELRTPLTILQGEVDIARLRRRSPEVYETALDTIGEQVSQMTDVVEDLLALARVDSGHLEIEREIVKMDELVQAAITQTMPLFVAKSLAVDVRLDPGLVILGDPGKLMRVVLNLLRNAARYTDQGGVNVLLQRIGEQAELSITDTGIGISDLHLERIFERFSGLIGHAHGLKGEAGLGLAIADWAIAAHGGTIHVESKPGQGSVFRVLLPLMS